MNALLIEIRHHFTFLMVSIVIGAVIVLTAKAAEKYLPSRRGISSPQRIAVIGMCSAISAVLYLMDFPVPFLAPPFYKLDFSEIPVLLCGFFLGPSAGVASMGIKVILKILLKSTSTAFVGDLANFVIGCALVLPAATIYHMRKNRRTALIGLIAGTFIMTVFGSFFNAVYLIPKFAQLYGIPIEEIIGMGQMIYHSVDSIYSLVIFCVAPLNLIKGCIVSLITFILYKRIEPVFLSISRK